MIYRSDPYHLCRGVWPAPPFSRSAVKWALSTVRWSIRVTIGATVRARVVGQLRRGGERGAGAHAAAAD